jgi:O-antigen/teichoic acid export membrane protein
MADNLQQKTFSGMIWTFAQHFSLEGFAFVQGIILARLLVPKDYGLIAMTQIFFAVARVFIDSGFGNALMRKKNRKEIDYSTVFVTNVVLTFFFAVALFLLAPSIGDFYKEPILKDIVRANAILLVINSVNAVQATRLRINLQFKIFGFISVVSTVSIGIITIVLAYLGDGVWSLIYPNFLAPFLNFILYWYFQRWRPKLQFSWKVWREYFAYGSNLLLASLITKIWDNLYPFIIGKKFSAVDLGYYSRAHGYANLPATSFQGTLNSVTFPVLSSIQDDDCRLRDAYRRLIRVSGYVVFPMLMGLAALAKPVILVLITDKWAASIPYLVVICFAAMLRPIQILNLNLLKVKGRSDLVLKLEVLKKTIYLLVILITMNYSVLAMCFGGVLSSHIALFINTYYTGKLIHVGYFVQMKDLLPSFLFSTTMGLLVYASTLVFSNMLIQLFVGIVLGITYYYFVSVLFKSHELDYIKLLLRENLVKRYRK